MKLVSVVIPNYNKRAALQATLRNLMGQVRFDLGDEVIIADDGSTDASRKMVKKKYPDARFVSLGRHDGYRLNSVRNMGIREAKNDFIIILDADCIPQPGFVETLRAQAEKGLFLSGMVIYEIPEEELKVRKGLAAKMFGSVMGRPSHTTEQIGERIIKAVTDFETLDEYLGSGTNGSNICFHKQDVIDVGMFDEEYDGSWGLDETDLILKLYLNGVDLKTVIRAMSHHQAHGSDGETKREGYIRNREILLRKLPAYRRREFK